MSNNKNKINPASSNKKKLISMSIEKPLINNLNKMSNGSILSNLIILIKLYFFRNFFIIKHLIIKYFKSFNCRYSEDFDGCSFSLKSYFRTSLASIFFKQT